MGKGRIALPKGRPPKPLPNTIWKVAPTEMPQPPEELKGEGLVEWRRLEPFLLAIDRVALIDQQPLYSYCLSWGRFASIMRSHFAQEDASLVADGPTCEIVHPLVPELLGYAKDMLHISGQFGLNPRDRDLDCKFATQMPSMLKRFYGNRSKVAEGRLPESIVPMLPDWDENDLLPPLWMNERMVRTYLSIGEELRNLDMFTPIDKIHICAIACLGDLQMRADEELVNDFTPVVSKMTGEVSYEKAHPLHKVIRDMTRMLADYWLAYGMSPKARRRLDTEKSTNKKVRPVIFTGANFG
jgi:phage terminase small subunit